MNTESAFRAIAHPTRRRILEMLVQRERAAGEIAAEFRHSQPVISRHLRDLSASGLIEHDRRGASNMYRLRPGALRAVRRWIESIDRPLR